MLFRSAPGTNNLSFNGGWTYDFTGATPNGSNAYANTGVNDITSLNLNDAHISFYSTTNSNGSTGIDMGAGGTGGPIAIQCGYLITNVRYAYANHSGTYGTNETAGNTGWGYYISNRTSSTTLQGWKNGTKVVNSANTSVSKSQNRIYIGALSNDTTQGSYGIKRCSFATIGYGLTDTEAQNLTTIINTFQTSIGRNTY